MLPPIKHAVKIKDSREGSLKAAYIIKNTIKKIGGTLLLAGNSPKEIGQEPKPDEYAQTNSSGCHIGNDPNEC